MGSKKKLKQAHFSKREKAHRAEELKALFEQRQTQHEPLPIESTSSFVTPTLTELTESQKRVQQVDLTQTMAAAGAVRTHERPKESTSLRTVIAHQPYSPARRLDQVPKVRAAEFEEKEQPNRGLGVVLLFAAIFLGFVGYWNIQYSQKRSEVRSHKPESSKGATAEDRMRVDFYRQQLGHRLNQQRVDVEVQNYRRAPSLSDVDRPGTHQSNMMRGLPLAPQTLENTTGVYSSRFRTTPLSSDHPDARIYYGLQEEQDRDEYARQVDRDYVEEFVKNARREGLKVELDSDYNVIDVQKDGRSLMRNPGSEQGPAR